MIFPPQDNHGQNNEQSECLLCPQHSGLTLLSAICMVAMVILIFNISIISILILTNYNANLQVFNFQCYKGHCFEPEHKQYAVVIKKNTFSNVLLDF